MRERVVRIARGKSHNGKKSMITSRTAEHDSSAISKTEEQSTRWTVKMPIDIGRRISPVRIFNV